MTRRPYIRPVRRYSWWLSQPRYVRYMAREVSAIFIGAYIIMLIVGLLRLSQGPAAYGSFLSAILSSAGVAFSFITFVFAVYHSVTWFGVTPKALPLRMGGKAVPPAIIIGTHWFVWAIATRLILLWVAV
ncbi:MAG: fumarate reductase subunit C [Proteobacteria bacterium]|nr:fumarate reductase subunit C [Pseudomonadota bacterium]MCH9006297.1 fumarate reductase subunit C [Pseudomonadota bacterium]